MRKLLMIGLALLGSAGCQAPTPADGQNVFAQRCAACHTVPKLVPSLRNEAAAQREAWLRKFLEQHHPPRSTQDTDALVTYLIKQAGN